MKIDVRAEELRSASAAPTARSSSSATERRRARRTGNRYDGVCVDRPHRDAGVAMRPRASWRRAMLGFIGVAGRGGFSVRFRACGARRACSPWPARLRCGARAWRLSLDARAAIGHRSLPDGLALWSRSGEMRHTRIAGCAQWSGRLLALTLLDTRGRRAIAPRRRRFRRCRYFRQLSVQARRAAAPHL